MFTLPKYTVFCLIGLLLSVTVKSQVFDFRYNQFDTDDGLPSPEIYDLYEDLAGNIWLATDRGVVKYNGYDFITYDITEGLANMVNFSFQPVGDGTFWLNGLDGSFSYWNGHVFKPFAFNSSIKKLRRNKKSWFFFLGIQEDFLFFHNIDPHSTEIKLPIYSINVCNGKIKEHRDGFWNFLTGLKHTGQLAQRKINIIRNQKEVIDSVSKNGNTIWETYFQWDYQNRIKRTQFIGENIIGVYQDNKENEWVLTKSGLYYLKNGNPPLESISLFSGVSVTSIHESKDGSFWVTSTDNGLFHIPNINIKQLRPKGWINGEAIYKLKKAGNYLIGKSEKSKTFLFNKDTPYSSYDTPYSWYDKSDSSTKFNNELRKEMDIEGIFHNYSLNVFPLNNEDVFVHTHRGFMVSDKNNTTPTQVYKFRCLSVTKDAQETVWVATTEGLFKWQPDYRKTSPELIPINGQKALRINDVKADRNGIWIVTPKLGLIYKTESTEHIIEHENLKAKTLHSIAKQNDSTLWISSNKGLHKIQYKFEDTVPVIEKLELFTITHGLISNYINDVSFWNDEVWLATDEGFCYFKPDQLSLITTMPTLQIDYLETNKTTWSDIDEVSLNHDENDISISYTGISHNKPKNGFYRYKINDRPWVKTSERKVSFLDLNHGKYTFSVQCQSDSGIWSKTESLVFSIKPHFLEQFWVRISALFILCVSIFLFTIRYRKGWKKKMENENKLRKSQLDTLRNQMNPHFMFNSLTTIQALIYKEDKHEASNYIGDFSSLMRKSLEYSRLDNISLEKEIQFIESYLALEKKRFKKLFEYQITIDPELNKNLLIPPLLLQPLLENSIKHGFRGIHIKGQIFLEFKKDETNPRVFKIIIRDNGVGMVLNKSSKSNDSMGMEIVKSRIDLIRKSSNIKKIFFHIESEIGTGTTIRLLLPLNL